MLNTPPNSRSVASLSDRVLCHAEVILILEVSTPQQELMSAHFEYYETLTQGSGQKSFREALTKQNSFEFVWNDKGSI